MLLTTKVIERIVLENSPCTKRTIQTVAKKEGYSFSSDSFKLLFDLTDVVPNGERTGDNKKYYVVEKGHFSTTIQKNIDVLDMHPQHLKNAINKKLRPYNNVDIRNVLNNEDPKLLNMLSAYFTYNLRQKIKELAELVK